MLISELIAKISNTKFIKDAGFDDGYGSLRSSMSSSEEITIYGDYTFRNHKFSVSQFGSLGSGFTENKRFGKWDVERKPLYNSYITYLYLNYDDGANECHVFELGNGIVKLSGISYRWTKI